VQILIWGLIVTITKISLYFVCMASSHYLEMGVEYALGWINLFPKFKLILVMMIIPLILNSIQFWMLDNIL
jgi:hypothetical protein